MLAGLSSAAFWVEGHNSVWLAYWLATGLLFADIYLVERRGHGGQLDPKRHLELSTLLESIPDGVLIFGANGKVVACNSAAEQLSGKKCEDLAKLNLAELAEHFGAHHQSGAPFEFEKLAAVRALQGEQVKHDRRMLRNPETGAELEILISASPLRDHNGALIGALVIVRDVTEIAALQRRIADIERHHAVGQMAAGLAHDFNNVLDTVVRAVAILELSADKPREERQAYLDMIKHAVRRGAEIIGQIREYLRTGGGRFVPLELDKLLSEVVDLTRPVWQVSRKIRLERQLEPVPEVRAVAAELRRVFTNLVINAIEAMQDGGTLTVGCQEKDGQVVAWVSDTGQGIRPEHQKNIFSPYHTTKPGGTGLGLSGAQRIVLSQGGTISFSTEVGKGTRFEVRLPVAKPEQERKVA